MATVTNRLLKLLNCSTSTSEAEHLCENPLTLSCGHYICKSCLQTGLGHTSIQCNICGKTNKRDLNQDDDPQAFQLIFEEHLKNLFNVTLQNFRNTFTNCKNMICNYEERIDNHIQYIKDNILIPIESVKIELDKLYEAYSSELDEIGEKWKSESQDIKFDKFDSKEFETELKTFEDSINTSKNLNQENIYKYQKVIKQIHQVIREYKENSPSLEFKECEMKVTKQIIGELIFDMEYKMTRRIKMNNYEQINVQFQPWDLCELSNGNLLLSNYNNANLQLYDGNMQEIKTISSINDSTHRIIGITSDENNNIYMCSYGTHCVIKADSNFNQLAIFGTYGSGQNQLYYPTGICYYNQSVYVCDYQNSRIQKLSSNLAFQASYALNYYPWYIKNINNIAIIRPYSESAIYFYGLNTFNLLKKYDGHNGIIGASKYYFCEYYPNNKTFYCYKKNGELVEQIQTNGQGLATSNNYGSICVMKEKILLTNYDSSLLTSI